MEEEADPGSGSVSGSVSTSPPIDPLILSELCDEWRQIYRIFVMGSESSRSSSPIQILTLDLLWFIDHMGIQICTQDALLRTRLIAENPSPPPPLPHPLPMVYALTGRWRLHRVPICDTLSLLVFIVLFVVLATHK